MSHCKSWKGRGQVTWASTSALVLSAALNASELEQEDRSRETPRWGSGPVTVNSPLTPDWASVSMGRRGSCAVATGRSSWHRCSAR